MTASDIEGRILRIKDKKLAEEVCRFLKNLSLLFDGHPPPHIQSYINEILELLEDKKYSSIS